MLHASRGGRKAFVCPVRHAGRSDDVLRDVLRAIAGDDLCSVRDRALLAFGVARRAAQQVAHRRPAC